MKRIIYLALLFSTALNAQDVDTLDIFSKLMDEYEAYLCDDSTETVAFHEESYKIAKLKLQIEYEKGYKHYTDTIMLRPSAAGWYPPHYQAYYYTEECKDEKYHDFISWVYKNYRRKSSSHEH